MSFDLNKHAARLLMQEPFFAALSRTIEKRATTAIPTAGVRVNPRSAQFELVYNPDFLGSLPDNQKLGVLKHEFYHCIFGHVTNRSPEGGLKKLDNIAMDLAINSHLRGELPDMCCMPGVGPFAKLPAGKSYEWYKAALEGEYGEDGEGGEPGDQGIQVPVQDRFSARDTDLLDVQPRQYPGKAQELREGQQGHPGHVLVIGSHAVPAAVVTAIGDAEPDIGDHSSMGILQPVARNERIIHRWWLTGSALLVEYGECDHGVGRRADTSCPPPRSMMNSGEKGKR